MKITEGGSIEISISPRGENTIELQLSGEEPHLITMAESTTMTISIPVHQIEGLSEFTEKKEKLRLKEITLNLGIAKIKFEK